MKKEQILKALEDAFASSIETEFHALVGGLMDERLGGTCTKPGEPLSRFRAAIKTSLDAYNSALATLNDIA
jgi:hypothetical protein